MTKDDIIKLAREAGFEKVVAIHPDGAKTVTVAPVPELLAFANLVAAAEREACAKGKRGSIALARQLCYEIAGATSEDDMDGHDYGSVDVAEILSAEVVRLQKALAQPAQEPVALHDAWSLREVYFDEDGEPSMHRSPPQRPWVGLTEQDMPSGEDPMFDHKYFIAGMVYAAKVLQAKNT